MEADHLHRIFELAKEKKAKGEDVIQLNVGEPDVDPPKKAIDGLVSSLRNKRFKYARSVGDERLREALARENKVSKENVVIGPGSKFLIYAFLKNIIKNPRDEVVIPIPYWSTFTYMLKDLGINKVRYIHTSPEKRWQPTKNQFEKFINENTRCVILTNPNNPTSTLIDKKVFDRVKNQAKQKRFQILVDGAYKDLVFDGENIPDPEARDLKNITYSFSFSKKYSMTGFRLGFLVTSEDIVDRIRRYNQITLTNVPLFVQDAGLAALAENKNFVKKMREIYKKRAKLVATVLEKEGVSFVGPQAGFYIFPKVNQDSEKLAYKLLEKGVAVVPGSAFGPYKDFIRISLTESEDRLEKGIRIILSNL